MCKIRRCKGTGKDSDIWNDADFGQSSIQDEHKICWGRMRGRVHIVEKEITDFQGVSGVWQLMLRKPVAVKVAVVSPGAEDWEQWIPACGCGIWSCWGSVTGLFVDFPGEDVLGEHCGVCGRYGFIYSTDSPNSRELMGNWICCDTELLWNLKTARLQVLYIWVLRGRHVKSSLFHCIYYYNLLLPNHSSYYFIILQYLFLLWAQWFLSEIFAWNAEWCWPAVV